MQADKVAIRMDCIVFICLLFQFFQSFFNHGLYVVVGLIVLLQAEQVLACIYFFVQGYIDVGQQDEAACQPVGMRSALVDEVQDLFFCFGIFALVVELLCQQVFGFGTVEGTGVFGQHLQVGHGFCVAFWFR